MFSPDGQHDILKQNINSASIITLPTNNTVEIVDMEQTTPVTNELVVEAEVTPTTDIAPTNEVVKEVEKNNYFIIAGSFKNVITSYSIHYTKLYDLLLLTQHLHLRLNIL